MRSEPPPSVPTASWPIPAASCAEAPPLEPPSVRSRFHGLRVTPVSRLSVTPFQPYSGVQVLPSSTAPASRRRAVAGASSFQDPTESTVFEPRSVDQPFAKTRSLIDAGTPSTGPTGSPLAQRASDACAAASAPSSSTRQKALSFG